jgi:hypothetical protein
VPAGAAAACVAELRELGLPAAEVGRLAAPGEAGPGLVTLLA